MDHVEKAAFAAGCFWHVEEIFAHLPGVIGTQVGYAGGTMEDPKYEDVHTGKTGHAESVEVTYDASRISYDRLLEVFWESHDPTTPGRQGPDVGDQYRSVIFYHTPEQKRLAEASRDRLARSGKLGGRGIVTEIVQAGKFYRAEEYHQRYLERRGGSSCGM